MTLRCYLIDDEEHAIDLLTKYIERTPGMELIGTQTDPLVALNAFSSGQIDADLTFMDIDMPQLSGMDLAELVHTHTHIIFTTAFKEYALGAFERNVLDYMLKPISYERFLKAVSKARERIALERPIISQKVSDHFFAACDGKLTRINFDDILYTEGAKNYIRLHMGNEIKLLYLTMSEIEERLPTDRFMRIHRSYHVNLDKIIGIESGMIHLSDGNSIPYGQSYQKDFYSRIGPDMLKTKR